jgi:serine/threonine-protein kinase
MTLGPGSLINGKYRLGRQLGEGGMGAIYEARHEFLGTEVALKFLHPALSSRPNVVARFVQEARVSANIKSPHVVQVVDVDQSPEGLAFLVMELLHGEPLSARLSREPILPLSLVVSIALQVLLALETAHAFGVVHRDMKPENVFLTDAPGAAGATSDGLLVKILDFGIAKLRTLGEVRAQLTRPGVVMGTPEYMSPEQVFSADAVDARADLYALGAMCFEMLAGQRPVVGEDARVIAARVMSGQTPRLDEVAPHVPSAIADVVAIALSPKPGDRFTSAAAMRQALVHAARDSNVAIDAPPAALKSRASLSIAEAASGQHPVLGGIGLGVAPPAMLGPGNPAAMVAFDARRNAPPAQLPPVEPAAPAPVSPPAPMPAEPEPQAETDRGGTLAAVPTPYAPPYGYGQSSPGQTDAGMMSPFANEAAYAPPETPEAMTSGEVYAQPSRRRGTSWLPIALGALLVIGGVILVVWALRPTSAAPPPPAPTVAPTPKATEEEEPTKK